jgi:hypothetical protein
MLWWPVLGLTCKSAPRGCSNRMWRSQVGRTYFYSAYRISRDLFALVWQDTLIPFTETHWAGSVAASSSSSSAFSLATIDKITLPEQVAAASGLQISVNGIQHLLDFDTQALTTRQSNLHQLLGQPEMDAICCITGKPTAEAAHLVKKSNPDVVRFCFHSV